MLTEKQERFAQAVALEGMTYSDAYRSAYDTKRMSNKTINEKASVLASEDKITARITELRENLVGKKIMSAQERMEWLTEVVKSEEETTSDKMKAIDIMNKMQGEYTQKIEADVKQEFTINVELVDDE